MLSFSVPPGYRRRAEIRRPKLDGFTEIIDAVAAGRSRPARQAAPHRQAGVRAAARRARVHRRLHHREGLHPRASPARPGDVRAAAPSAGACPGRLRRSDGGDRRASSRRRISSPSTCRTATPASSAPIRRRPPRPGSTVTSMPSPSSAGCRSRCSTTTTAAWWRASCPTGPASGPRCSAGSCRIT